MLITHHEQYVRNIKVTFGIIEQFTTLLLYQEEIFYNEREMGFYQREKYV